MIYKRKIYNYIILIIGLILLSSTYSFASTNITLQEYKEKLNIISKQSMNKLVVLSNFSKIKDNKCRFKKLGDYYILKPICLYTKQYPKLNFREAVDLIRPYVQGFNTEYNLEAQEFTFQGTQPILNYTPEISLANYYDGTITQKKVITELETLNINIKIHKKYFARYTIKDLSFYPVRRNRNGLGDCAFTNYRIGLSVLNNLYLEPQKVFNMNQAISFLPGYCKGNSPDNYPFYGGSCGSAGQLFKTALLVPGITITKRQSHIRRWAQFYGPKYIYGDDAAILDTRKQLEIKNTNIFPIYFKTILYEDYDYTIAILPFKYDRNVHITKQQTGPLSASVIKKTYDSNTLRTISQQIFNSKYGQFFAGTP